MTAPARRKLLIDTDPGVDDTLAIFMAFNSPEVEVIGLTTTFGNCRTAMSTANALHLCEMAGRTDVPVAQGATGPLKGGANERFADYVHGADGLGNTGAPCPSSSPCGLSAAQFIVDCVNGSPGEVTLLALASLTNVALALHLDPSIASKLHALLYLGGAFFCMGNVNPVTEANVWHDPEAADWVLGAFPDGVASVVGLDVTTRSVMRGQDLEQLRDCGGRFGEYVWSICQFYKSYHQRVMGLDGIYLHDPSALVACLRPELFTWTEGAVRVSCEEGLARGKTFLDTGAKQWALQNAWSGRPKCRVALQLDAPAVLADCMQRLSSL